MRARTTSELHATFNHTARVGSKKAFDKIFIIGAIFHFGLAYYKMHRPFGKAGNLRSTRAQTIGKPSRARESERSATSEKYQANAATYKNNRAEKESTKGTSWASARRQPETTLLRKVATILWAVLKGSITFMSQRQRLSYHRWHLCQTRSHLAFSLITRKGVFAFERRELLTIPFCRRTKILQKE